MSLTCGLTVVEATQDKEQGKDNIYVTLVLLLFGNN